MIVRSASFLRAYRAFPHWLVNGAAMTVARQTRPAFLVDAAVRAWKVRDKIDMNDFTEERHDSLESFFLRRLKPGARPIGGGIVAPVDGCVVGLGTIECGTILQVKGTPLSVDRLVNGSGKSSSNRIQLDAFEGGTYITLFLRPRGYHFVHAPSDLTIDDVRWIPGRFFPQNEDALRHIPRIYERNERAVLRTRSNNNNSDANTNDGETSILVMVGASVVGGIHVNGVSPSELRQQSHPTPVRRSVKKGEELGHFSFGSTVVLLLPRGIDGAARRAPRVALGDELKMGESLFQSASSS